MYLARKYFSIKYGWYSHISTEPIDWTLTGTTILGWPGVMFIQVAARQSETKILT